LLTNYIYEHVYITEYKSRVRTEWLYLTMYPISLRTFCLSDIIVCVFSIIEAQVNSLWLPASVMSIAGQVFIGAVTCKSNVNVKPHTIHRRWQYRYVTALYLSGVGWIRTVNRLDGYIGKNSLISKVR